MNKEWCKEHITTMNNWFVTKSGKRIEIQDDWNFCPICGTPRPEPKKGLAVKLRDGTVWTFPPTSAVRTSSIPMWETTAKAALEHFSEIVDAEFSFVDGGSIAAERLKKKFKESL